MWTFSAFWQVRIRVVVVHVYSRSCFKFIPFICHIYYTVFQDGYDTTIFKPPGGNSLIFITINNWSSEGLDFKWKLICFYSRKKMLWVNCSNCWTIVWMYIFCKDPNNASSKIEIPITVHIILVFFYAFVLKWNQLIHDKI